MTLGGAEQNIAWVWLRPGSKGCASAIATRFVVCAERNVEQCVCTCVRAFSPVALVMLLLATGLLVGSNIRGTIQIRFTFATSGVNVNDRIEWKCALLYCHKNSSFCLTFMLPF